MTLTVRPIQAEPFPEVLLNRHQRWRVTLVPAHGTTEPLVIAADANGTILPPGTQVVISSSMVRLRFSLFVRAGVPVYETLHGSARPAVTAVIYRRTPNGIDVGVIFQKRYFFEAPALRSYCDEEGFLLCGEPPGGGIEDTDESPPRDLLQHAPSTTAIMVALKREVKEEFGEVEIKAIHLLPHPVSSVAVGGYPLYVAFVEVASGDVPLHAEPEPGEQIVGRGFVPLEFALDRCLDQYRDGVFWGRVCNFWPLLDHWLRRKH